MEDINRFGPELALLIAAGLIVVGDVTLPMRGETRRVASVALGLAGLAVSAVWSLVLIVADERGQAFEGLMVVDDFSLFFTFLFAGLAAVIMLASMGPLQKLRLRGATNLNDIAAFVAGADSGSRPALVLAAVFLAAGLGFKMAVVPFQMWVPDVYQGAATPVTAYLSVASKAAGFAVVMRIFVVALGQGLISSDWSNMFAAIAAISMTLGN